MPVINDIQLDQVVLPNSHYGYSATRLDDLGATAVPSSPLHFVDCDALNSNTIHDAHLLLATHRLRHAIGRE
jgi:hypothetical protein